MASLNQLLFIETFVFGAATIAAVYHLVLFLQQRDRFLLFYSIYLFSLSSYIGFKLISDNYSPFVPSTQMGYYLFEEILQISMVCIYTTFAAVTLEVTFRDRSVMILWLAFLVIGVLSIASHFMSAIGVSEVYTTRFHYGVSRFSIIAIATIALVLVWRRRKTPFQRTIIIGSLVYDLSGFLSALSFTTDSAFLGLSGVEPYLVGCLADIIIFSSAFGYRIKKIAAEKNALLLAELNNQFALSRMRTSIASDLHDDVGSTLSSISIYSEAVKMSIHKEEKEKAIDMLGQLGHDARHAISTMSDIVWAINPGNDSSDKLMMRMRSFAVELCMAKGIKLVMTMDEDLLNRNWSMVVRNGIYLIYKEAVNNSLKYADATILEISFSIAGDAAVLLIKDNGTGFDQRPSDVTENENAGSLGGNGISNMRWRAKEIHARFQMVSDPHKGTSVQLALPLSLFV